MKVIDVASILGKSTGLALVDCSASSESINLLKQRVDLGCCIVLANKKPLTSMMEDYEKLVSFPHYIRHEPTVGAGLPVIASLNRIISSGDPIHCIIGSLSGTLGYVMSEVEGGKPLSQVVRLAKSLGYTEPDPRDDLSGMDVGRKALILARLLGRHLNLESIKIESLYPQEMGPDEISVDDFLSSALLKLDENIKERVKTASANGNVLRYVCLLEGSRCEVGLQELPKNSPLGRLRGSDNVISRASSSPEISYIAKPAASWLDDFLVWISPDAFGCCRKFIDGTYCPPDDQPPCCSSDEGSCDIGGVCKDCMTCFRHADLINARPSTEQFREKLPWFLNALPSADCAKGGHGAYTTSVDLNGFESGVIRASEFRTYHTPVNKQGDYVNSIRAAREFAARMSESLKIDVFPYSVFYIFFEQYLDIWRVALSTIAVALGAIFLVCLIITSSLWLSVIITLVLVMIIVDLMGIMAILNIQLNAVSAVNLVMSIGIAVEFCVHIAHAFMVTIGDRDYRMKAALSTMGASVFSGITLTKLVGVIVLCFSRSEIFVVYYFQMYLALVIVGFLHGLVFLPVLLSLFGPPPRHVANPSQPGDEPSAT